MPDDPAGALKKQVGPLPLGIWLLAIGGGLGLAYVIRRRQGATAAQIGAVGGNQAAPVPTDTSPASNDTWRVGAERGLINNGFDPLNASQAIEGFLSGATLSPAQQAIVDAALKANGPAPQAPPPPTPGTLPSDFTAPSPGTPADTTVGAAPPPANPPDTYAVGQTVNPATGEKIVDSTYSPTFGWLNLTNLGGIYTGSPGAPISALQQGGSYLGYAATTPNPAAEIAAHGKFAAGGLQLTPAGYTEKNQAGETYHFGPY